MNAVYNLGPRLEAAKRWGKETLAGGELEQQAVQRLRQRAAADPVLSDAGHGVDAARARRTAPTRSARSGALNRVYLNIGLFSEEWLLPFQRRSSAASRSRRSRSRSPTQELGLLAGHRGADARAWRCSSWRAHGAAPTEGRAGRRRLPAPRIRRSSDRGKIVFAEQLRARATRARRRSRLVGARHRRLRRARLSRLLEPLLGVDQDRRVQAEDAGDRARRRTSSTATTSRPRRACPVTLLADQRLQPARHQCARRRTSGTTSRRSPTSDLPSVGHDHGPRSVSPASRDPYDMPAGGRGYTRPASLISVWSTAPFLLNNSGRAVRAGSVGRGADARVSTPRSSKMLWPEKRDKPTRAGRQGSRHRSTAPTRAASSRIPVGFQPEILRPLSGPAHDLLAAKSSTPTAPSRSARSRRAYRSICWPIRGRCRKRRIRSQVTRACGKLIELPVIRLKHRPSRRCRRTATDAPAAQDLLPMSARPLISKLNKCPDFVVNRGSLFRQCRILDWRSRY